ncbi:MAG: NAD(P)-binding domain-containing protein [Bacillota bacterium]
MHYKHHSKILKKGFPLAVYDLVPDKMQRLAAAGAVPAAAREAAARAALIVSMLPRPADTEALVQAYIVIENTYATPFVEHAALELEASNCSGRAWA